MEKIVDEFSVKFTGPTLENHTIDVRILAPSLLALADALKSAQKELSPDSPAPAIEIKATRPGSFDVALVATTTFLQEAVSLFSGEPVTAFLNATGIASLLAWAMKILVKIHQHGKPTHQTPLESGDVNLEWADGTTMTVPANSVKLVGHPETRKHLKDFVDPVNEEGFDSLDLKTKASSVTVKPDDLPAFEIPDVPDREETSSIRRTILRISQPTLNGSYVWRVNDGTNTFTASMEDENFQRAIKDGTERFGDGDQLIVDLKEVQFTRADGSLRTDRKIVKVYDHTRPPGQMMLPIFEDDSSQ
jgi:hypothetical protein